MQMDSLEYWHSSEGVSLLAWAKEAREQYPHDPLRAGTLLRKKLPTTAPNLIAQAFDILQFRAKASPFGAWTEHGFFTRQSLEQATVPLVAQHHAQRFAGCRHVLEICTGAGFDTAALARYAARVTSIEARPELAAMARQNLAAQGISNVEVICGLAEDVLQNLDISLFDGLWCDPSRRDEQGRRIQNPHDYAPSLKWLQDLRISGVAGIKISPAANLQDTSFLATPRATTWQREWIGVGEECREQVLWRGVQLADGTASLPETGDRWTPPLEPLSVSFWNQNCTSVVGQYLIEPHGCIIRSGRLQDFFAERDISLLDEHIAFGICASIPPKSAWYQAFRILEAFRFHRSSLRERILARFWGNALEIKKRGFPETPDEIRKWLKLPPSKTAGTLIITRVHDGHLAFLAERV
jgi:SAM-dependent methyltransferase